MKITGAGPKNANPIKLPTAEGKRGAVSTRSRKAGVGKAIQRNKGAKFSDALWKKYQGNKNYGMRDASERENGNLNADLRQILTSKRCGNPKEQNRRGPNSLEKPKKNDSPREKTKCS